MYRHIAFLNGSNPYISFTDKNFFEFVKNYDLEMIGKDCFVATEKQFLSCKGNISNYAKAKAALQEFATEFSNRQGDFSMSWCEICEWTSFFSTYGKKYGLLREFRENGLC